MDREACKPHTWWNYQVVRYKKQNDNSLSFFIENIKNNNEAIDKAKSKVQTGNVNAVCKTIN